MVPITIFILCIILVISPVWAMPDKPNLMLANTANLYSLADKPNAYLVSEKLDGVRAYWTGRKLITRSGKTITTPNWFTKALPNYPLEGELWIARESFSELMSVINRVEDNNNQWQKVKFMLFDLPDLPLAFEQRVKQLQTLEKSLPEHIRVVDYQRFEHFHELEHYFRDITLSGAEGMMMNLANAKYQPGRHQTLFKVKPYYDAEAIVIDHVAGKGKFENMMGALLVKNKRGQTFKLGTGFSMAERQNPPKFGEVVTYKFFGYTSSGLPRFASFLRVRKDP